MEPTQSLASKSLVIDDRSVIIDPSGNCMAMMIGGGSNDHVLMFEDPAGNKRCRVAWSRIADRCHKIAPQHVPGAKQAMEFRTVYTVAEAVEVLANEGNDARILAGGTDVVIQHLRGEIRADLLLHVARVAALDGVVHGERLRLGSLTTHRRIATDSAIRRDAPALAQAAATVGGWQTQAVGTIGGNVCNASPAADTVPPLLVADATVTLASRRGGRSLPIADFIVGRRDVDRRPDELLTELELEPLSPHSAEIYLKVSPRHAMEVALVGLAVRLTLGADGTSVADARIAACAVGPRPFRAHASEAVLRGCRLEPERIAEAGALLTDQASPIDDSRASARYRRRVLAPLLARALDRCRRAAAGGD